MNTRINSAHGFTLIELLVTITIMGILASVVLSSLNSARDKGVDAKVRANLAGFSANSSIYFDDNNGTYLGFCSSPNILDSLNSATSSVASIATPGGMGDGECYDSNAAWAAWVNMREASTTAWCVDSEGKSTLMPAQDSSGVNLVACP
jgi:prepilin-type N-terminal cleavage/methylation domain-containing protein